MVLKLKTVKVDRLEFYGQIWEPGVRYSQEAVNAYQEYHDVQNITCEYLQTTEGRPKSTLMQRYIKLSRNTKQLLLRWFQYRQAVFHLN